MPHKISAVNSSALAPKRVVGTRAAANKVVASKVAAANAAKGVGSGGNAKPNTSGVVSTATPRQVGKPPSLSAQRSGYTDIGITNFDSAQLVLVLGLLLYMAIEWDDVFKPLFGIVWTGLPVTAAPIQWGNSLGMLVMLGIMVVIASFNADTSSLMLIMVLGMWLVYVIEKPTNSLVRLFNWLAHSGTYTTQNNPPSYSVSGSATQHPK